MWLYLYLIEIYLPSLPAKIVPKYAVDVFILYSYHYLGKTVSNQAPFYKYTNVIKSEFNKLLS